MNIIDTKGGEFDMADDKKSTVVFTPEEEARIQAAVKASQDKEREELIETEIRNRILDANKGKPGYNY